jgi:CheY-like chemotaxis protein
MHLLRRNANSMPDILFLDLNMPRKNGYQCLEEIKNNSQFEQLPITIFSTSYEPTIANKLYKNGARYYICKSPDFLQFKSVIHIALTLLKTETASMSAKEVFLLNDLEKMLLMK